MEVLQAARIEQGLSAQALAAALGTTRDQVEAWESGHKQASLPVLLEWALALQLNIEFRPRAASRVDTPPISFEARLAAAFSAADRSKRDAIALLLGLDRPAPASVVVELRRGRPLGAGPGVRSMRLSSAQQTQLAESPVPHTGNRLLTALKLADATIRHLAFTSNLRYSTVARLVAGRRKRVPAGYAEHLAACFGCAPGSLFPFKAAHERHTPVERMERRSGRERRAIPRGCDRRGAWVPLVV